MGNWGVVRMIDFSVILVNHSKIDVARYAILSWMFQKFKGSYEVIILHCDQDIDYYELFKNKPDNCTIKLYYIPKPSEFCLSDFRNLGAAYSSGKYLIFSGISVIHQSTYLEYIYNLYEKGYGYIFTGQYEILYPSNRLNDYRYYLSNFDDIINYLREGDILTISYGTYNIPREFFIDIGGYKSDLYFHEDDELKARTNYFCGKRGIKSIEVLDDLDCLSIYLMDLIQSHVELIKDEEHRVSSSKFISSLFSKNVPSNYKELFDFPPLTTDVSKLNKRIYKND